MTIQLAPPEQRQSTPEVRGASAVGRPIAPGDREHAAELGRLSGEARRAKGERNVEQLAASALRKILVRLERDADEMTLTPKDMPGLIRALSDVARGASTPLDTAAIAQEILTKARALNGKGQKD